MYRQLIGRGAAPFPVERRLADAVRESEGLDAMKIRRGKRLYDLNAVSQWAPLIESMKVRVPLLRVDHHQQCGMVSGPPHVQAGGALRPTSPSRRERFSSPHIPE